MPLLPLGENAKVCLSFRWEYFLYETFDEGRMKEYIYG